MADNDWKKRLGMVYSTNPDFVFEDSAHSEPETLPAARQKLKVRMERSGRGGKTVTLVEGFEGDRDSLAELGKTLKVRRGVGGTARDGVITVQGDLREKVTALLIDLGYSGTKRSN